MNAYGVNIAHSGTVVGILIDENMDYEKIGKKIQKMRQSSLEFLKNALENYDSSDM